MSYFRILGLTEEPFSTSPDPAFYYDSPQHHTALTRLMIELRLRRGLSVILGEVGTGKTTLSRKIYQMLRQRSDILFHMILDPTDEDPGQFLHSLIRTFKLEERGGGVLDAKQALQTYLYRQGVKERKTVVLLIDEAQKLSGASLETLRVLLNYETNEFKLLQVVLLGQVELLPRLRQMNNFWDRISMRYLLQPLSEEQTRELIRYRLRAAGCVRAGEIFSETAVRAIYYHTRGYPRRIAMLSHRVLKELVMRGQERVEADLVRELIEEELKIDGLLSVA